MARCFFVAVVALGCSASPQDPDLSGAISGAAGAAGTAEETLTGGSSGANVAGSGGGGAHATAGAGGSGVAGAAIPVGGGGTTAAGGRSSDTAGLGGGGILLGGAPAVAGAPSVAGSPPTPALDERGCPLVVPDDAECRVSAGSNSELWSCRVVQLMYDGGPGVCPCGIEIYLVDNPACKKNLNTRVRSCRNPTECSQHARTREFCGAPPEGVVSAPRPAACDEPF